MASSQLYPGEVVYDDSTDFLEPPPGQSRGLVLYNRPKGYAYGGVAEPFPQELLIPESEWQARIQEMEERKTRLSDLMTQAGLPCKDQARTNYCWINAPVHCLEIVRVLQNQKTVVLSPASAGAPIKNFTNQGGWGKEGLEWIVERGVCPVDLWPANAIDRTYYTDANRQAALDYRVTEWWELRPRNKAEHISCLLRRIPAAVGLNYWSHEVTDYEPVWIDGTVAVRFRNSWTMDWPQSGAMGYSIRQGSRMLADDIVAPRVALAT